MSELRVRKMQEFIKQEVGNMLLRELKDPRLGFVTVTGVKLTGDLREATVYVSLFGQEEERKESRRKFISKYPASLIDVPENRKLFSREEIERLIPLAEKVWIESEGRLPWNYVSPVEKGE